MESKSKRESRKVAGAFVGLLLGSIAMAGLVQATPPESNPGQPFEEILDAIEALSEAQSQIAEAFGAQVDSIEAKVDAIADQLADMQAQLDDIEDALNVLDVEAIGTEAFADPGQDPVADIPGNNALILVRVTFHGAGVSGLTADDFTIATRLVPPGECGLEIDELSSFGGPDGDYALAVTPIDTEGCDWEAGSYISTIEVSSEGMTGSTLVEVVVT